MHALEYRKGPNEKSVLHFVSVKNKNKQQINGGAAKFHVGLGNPKKEIAADPEIIEVRCCKKRKPAAVPRRLQANSKKKLTHRTFCKHQSVHFMSVTPELTNCAPRQKSSSGRICVQIKTESQKNCSACLNASKSSNCQIPPINRTRFPT